jgi:hypothetical protein
MKVGDLVMLRMTGGASGVRSYKRINEVGVIIDIVTHTETYTSSGCKKYIVLTARGDEQRCWQGEIEVINESR